MKGIKNSKISLVALCFLTIFSVTCSKDVVEDNPCGVGISTIEEELIQENERLSEIESTPIEFTEMDQKVLVIFPHPDDEVSLGSILGKLCLDLGGDCTFLVLTKGEGNTNGDTNIRHEEMIKVANYLGAKLIHWDLGNFEYPGDEHNVMVKWSEKAGGSQELLDNITQVILDEEPDIIFISDPRHANTCHAEHAVTAKLVLKALENIVAEPKVYLKSKIKEGMATYPDVLSFDASEYSSTLEAELWEYQIDIGKFHESHGGNAECIDFKASVLRRMDHLKATRQTFIMDANDLPETYTPDPYCGNLSPKGSDFLSDYF